MPAGKRARPRQPSGPSQRQLLVTARPSLHRSLAVGKCGKSHGDETAFWAESAGLGQAMVMDVHRPPDEPFSKQMGKWIAAWMRRATEAQGQTEKADGTRV